MKETEMVSKQKLGLQTRYESDVYPMLTSYSRYIDLESIKEALQLKDIDLDKINIDEIGTYFERSLDHVDRKQQGQYYTSPSVIRYILESLHIDNSSRILDPTCGCGSFILNIYEYLSIKYARPNLNNIFGVDLNPVATDITRLCMFLKSGRTKDVSNILNKNIRVGNSILATKSFNWKTSFKDVLDEGGFDFIVGNPPYGFISKTEFNVTDSEYADIASGRLNIASLIVVKSLTLLKDNGILALLLPKSILHVESYRNLRKYLLVNSKILEIYDLGIKFSDVRGEQIILFLQKTKTESKTFKISTGIDTKSNHIIKPKKSLKSNYTCLTPDRFLVLDEQYYYTILNKLNFMKNTIPLIKFVNGQIFRGITLESSTYKKLSKIPSSNAVKILRGRSISKYNIDEPYYGKNLNIKDKNKHKIQLLSNNKLVLQNIFSSESGLIAAFDPEGAITSDTVTNIIVDDEKMGKYLLGLFNSKLVTFYLIFGLFNRSKLTIHIDKKYLGQIPIHIKPDNNTIQNIVKLVSTAMTADKPSTLSRVTTEIDNHVFKLYDMTRKDIKVITTAVDRHLSFKSRMVKCLHN